MFHKVYKSCKNDLDIIIIFGTILSFVVAAFIIGFIAKEKRTPPLQRPQFKELS